MDRDEAFALLGIDEATDAKQVRRAYLKQIRIHKPDRAPERFRRIREAYDQVTQMLEMRAIYAYFEHAGDVADDASGEEPADAAMDAPVEQDHAEVMAAPPLESVVVRDSPAGLLRGAVEALEGVEPDPDRAESLALEAFEAARQALDADDALDYHGLQLCLTLYAARRPAHARRVTAAVERWLLESGRERALMLQGDAGSWVILRLLAQLPGVHAEPLAIIGHGLLTDEDHIEPALYAFAQAHPFAAIETREAMERRTPPLAEMWGPSLRQGELASDGDALAAFDPGPQAWPPSTPKPRQTFGDGGPWLSLGISICLLLSWIVRASCDTSTLSDRASIATDAPWPGEPSWVSGLCRSRTSTLCRYAMRLRTKLVAGDCDGARVMYRELNSNMVDSRMQNAHAGALRALRKTCPRKR